MRLDVITNEPGVDVSIVMFGIEASNEIVPAGPAKFDKVTDDMASLPSSSSSLTLMFVPKLTTPVPPTSSLTVVEPETSGASTIGATVMTKSSNAVAVVSGSSVAASVAVAVIRKSNTPSAFSAGVN